VTAGAPAAAGRAGSGERDVALALLAAGGGTRLGGSCPKPLATVAGRPLVSHALDSAIESGLAPVLLVVGAGGEEVAAAAPDGVEVVVNDHWSTGIASSLGAVVRWLDRRGDIGALAIGLADQPLVGPEAYRRIARAYHLGARIAAATYGGRRAHPVLVARELWGEARALEGDAGARVLMRAHPVGEVACDGTGDPADVDTSEDLAALEARWRSETRST